MKIKRRTDLVIDDAFLVTGDPGRDGIDGRNGVDGRDGTDGRAGVDGQGFRWLGAWKRGSYEAYSVVEHEGSTYICTKPTTKEPPHPSWDLMASRGEQGERGEDGIGQRGRPGRDGTNASVAMNAIFDSNTVKGQVVYVSGDGHVDLAQANGEPQALAVGIALQDVAAGHAGQYVPVGPVDCDTWTLTPGSVYYLSPSTPGGMTATFPNTEGDHVVVLGAASSATSINLKIDWALVIGS